jgi:hypothetical protein
MYIWLYGWAGLGARTMQPIKKKQVTEMTK